MPIQWTSDGENGVFEALIDLEDGSQPRRFKGASHRDVADKLLDAQLKASQRINQLKGQIPVEPAKAPTPTSQPLSAEERFQLARDITDPAKSDAAVTRILRSVGIPVEDIRRIIATQREEEEFKLAEAEAIAFATGTPEWYPTEHNKNVLAAYIRNNNMAGTRQNIALAFDTLMEANLLQRRPEEPTTTTQPETEPEPITRETTRPRNTVSTGMRSAQGRATPPPAAPRSKLTKQAIRNMPSVEYKRRLLTEPGFAAAVDAAV